MQSLNKTINIESHCGTVRAICPKDLKASPSFIKGLTNHAPTLKLDAWLCNGSTETDITMKQIKNVELRSEAF